MSDNQSQDRPTQQGTKPSQSPAPTHLSPMVPLHIHGPLCADPAAEAVQEKNLLNKGSAVYLRRLQIVNKRGLHARASAKFVSCVDRFDADVTVSRDKQTVDGNSIMGLMMLAAATGSFIDIKATGEEAEAALNALDDLVSSGFGETD